jgi:hypothetical protein
MGGPLMYREKKTRLTAYRKLTAGSRLLPDFIIISVERGGSTSLYRYITTHPCVEPAFRKEVHYFDLNFSQGPAWYRAHFPTRWRAAWLSARKGHRLLTGEASPYYLYHPHVPVRISKTLPEVRLIALVRNPVERAYSHYQLNRRQGKEPLSFEEAIDSEEERLRGEYERLARDETYYSDNHYKFGYLARGVYVDRLKRWREHFPADRLLVVASEELYERPRDTLAQVNQFLGLPEWQPAQFKPYNQKPYSEINAKTRHKLLDYFEPHNRRLYEFLGRDLGWR